ncbi:hypothetical protein DWV16_16975 [Anaerotruncus sp. AF02-27]|uniref:hypothetical protein n=1 Tax=Anaerotruncus sp. AF02-27 TaxID=2292191 RepID=UPI000E528AAC|nr:hypothetical protein [Anaerotruncus sp. AF02-27]RGX53314.1 hypothetical protein DWV16_16975 [Anaerotruncus sp. AF02-27]
MDDLNSTISSILGDPQKMEQLRAVAQSLGIDTGAAGAPGGQPAQNTPPPPSGSPGNQAAPSGGGVDPAAIASILQNFQNMGGTNAANAANTASAAQNAGAGSGPDLGAFSKIAGLMSAYNQSDKNVELLRSLKPHFSPTRASKIDDAVRIMQIIRMWPALRDSGLLGSLGNLFGGGGNNR